MGKGAEAAAGVRPVAIRAEWQYTAPRSAPVVIALVKNEPGPVTGGGGFIYFSQEDWGITAMFKSRWWVVLASFLALIVGQGAVEVFATGVFIKPLAQDLNLGRGVISTAMGLANITTALMVTFTGRWMDKYGVRPVLLPFLVLFAVVTGCLSLLAPSAVTMLMVMFALQGIVGAAQTPTPYSKMITARFDDHRGLALGLALAGVGAGTALLPQYSRILLGTWGWRGGYVGIGGAILLLSFIPVALWFGETPEMCKARQAGTEERRRMPGLEFAEVTRTRRFWLLGIAFFFADMAINGSLIHAVPMLTDRGISIGRAVAVMGTAGLALIIGRLIAGWLLDRVFAAYIQIFFLVCPMIGLGLLLSPLGGSWPLVGTMFLGVGIGAEIDIIAFMISRYFGIKAFGVMHGLMMAFAALANAAGNNLLGWCYQLLHTYRPGLMVMEVLLAIAVVIQATMGPYRYPMVRPEKKPAAAAQ
jgi:MFS family permease